jgi:hypothetical protein
VKITFANNYTTRGGRDYKGGTTAEVNDADARSLIVRGKARPAAETVAAPAAAVPSAPAETEAKKGL